MQTYLIDPKNPTKPYNFSFLLALNRKKYPFTFLGYIPDWWDKYLNIKGGNFFLPVSRGVFKNKKTQKVVGGITQTLEMLIGYLRLRSIIKDNVILHFLWFLSPSVEQYIIPRIRKASLIHNVHNLLPHRNRKSDFKRFKKIYSKIDFIIVHDCETKEKLNNVFKFENKVKVIPHGNMEDFYNIFDKTNKRQSEVFLGQNIGKLKKPIFFFMGPVKPYKGFNTLINAVENLNKKGYNYSLVIKDKKQKDIKNVYYLPINLPYSHLGLIYRSSDVVIIPHMKISQSITLFEAGYFEKPVIVSSTGGLKETVRDRIDGFIFEKGKSNSLASKMEYLIQSPDECIRMGINFKENLIKKYSWDDIIDKWIKVYEEFTL